MTLPKDMTNGDLADYIDPRCREINVNDLSRDEQIYIYDEAAARLRATDWQPIESAPRDGTRVLAYDRDKPITECWWESESGPWASEFWTNDEDSEPNPTHWQPLPPPPKEGE